MSLVAEGLNWSAAYMMIGLEGYIMRDWRLLQGVMSSLAILVIPFFLLMQESPRWLTTKDKMKRAKENVAKIGRINGKSELQADDINIELEEEEVGHKGKNVFQALTLPVMRKKLLIQFYGWFSMSMVYFGLALSIGAISGNPYMNIFWAGLIEFFGRIIGNLVIIETRLGRRWCYGLYLIICGAMLLLIVPIDNKDVAGWIAVFGIALSSIAFSHGYLYSVELNPTEIRSSAMGMCSFFARVGAMLAPFVNQIGRQLNPSVPSIVFGLISLSSGILSLFLPETLCTKLPDTVEEGEKVRVKRFFSLADISSGQNQVVLKKLFGCRKPDQEAEVQMSKLTTVET